MLVGSDTCIPSIAEACIPAFSPMLMQDAGCRMQTSSSLAEDVPPGSVPFL